MAAHLLNTFLLLAAIALSVYWASGGGAMHLDVRRPGMARLATGGLALLLVSVMGAITALGDTLFPSATLGEGLTADLSGTSHILVRLRTIHPVLAVLTALALMSSASRLAEGRPAGLQSARLLVWLLGIQLVAGFANVLLLAPVWLQMVHLLLADAVWIAYVFLAADALADTSRQAATAPYTSPAQVH